MLLREQLNLRTPPKSPSEKLFRLLGNTSFSQKFRQ